jgi:prevent-host-death family protein
MCYARGMDDKVSVRDLRNHISAVLRRVESGERITVTVDRRPVAELSPLPRRRTWVPSEEAHRALDGALADPALVNQLRAALPDTTDQL